MIGGFLLGVIGSLMMGYSGVELFVNSDVEARKLRKKMVWVERMPYGFRLGLNEDEVGEGRRVEYRGDGTVDVVDVMDGGGGLIYAAYNREMGENEGVSRLVAGSGAGSRRGV